MNAKDFEGRTALLWACSKRLSGVALAILKRDNVDVNAMDSEGRTALYWASEKSLSDVALEILKRDNVDLNAKDSEKGRTALYWACHEGQFEVVRVLLQHSKTDMRVKTKEGSSPLDVARTMGHVDIVLLLEDRANDMKTISKCVVCCERAVDHVVLDCGHLCLCSVCESRVITKCPICRSEFRCKQRVFMS